MHCSQFFYDQNEQSSSSQFRTVAGPFDFVDIPDAPEEPDILGSFTDSLAEFQPSQIFQSASHSQKPKCKKSSVPLVLENSDFSSLGKLRKSNEEFSKIHTSGNPSQQYSYIEAGVVQEQDKAPAYQQRITKETPKLIPGTRPDINDFKAEGKNHFYRNKSDEVYTPAALVLPTQNTVGIQLKSVEELPNQFRNIFDFPYFNIVQSRVFEEVFYTDKPLVVCAPTGAGKTVIFELGIIRLIMKMGRNVNNSFKVVYMAPIKALCSERFQDWQTKFGEFGLKCMELTGDTDIQDYFELQNVNIIFTTPEKWDSMTRRWRDHSFVIQSVCLFFIDEIHVLNDNTRGATIEAVVSRMKTVQASVGRASVGLNLPKLRFIAVSATIPNIEDIAEWLGEIDKTKATFFKMDESLRPVRLRKVVLGFPFDEQKGSDFQFDMSLSYKLSGIINTYSDRKPCLVFCSTRKSTQQAAEILSRDSRGSYVRNSEMKQTLQKYYNLIKDGKLRDLILKGIAFHHAGMDLHDRKMIEELFSTGQLQVLVATSTLAMGVNLPAHLVILKSTQHYNMGAIEEYSDTQVLQMIGRAGRPQFDTTATAVIMTKIKNKMKYESLLNGTQLIESSLHKHLIEHLNAEIVLHTINDLSIAMEWIRYTFLYIRVMKNPKHYSMPLGLSREQIETRLQDLCMRNLNQLASINLITMDGETFDVKPTDPGKLMARYCIAFETMKKFCSLSATETIENLVKMIAESEEFTEIQLRVNEKKLLNTLNKDKNRTTIRYPMQGKIKTKQMKVNCLIQAQLGSLLVQDFSLQQDTTRIFRAAQRLVRCLVELLWTKQDYTSFLHALQLCKCIKTKLWEDSKHVTKQLDGIGPTLSNALANAGVTSFQKVEETNPRELELIVNRHPPFGNQVRVSVASLPKYELTIEQVSQYSNARSEVIIYLSIANQDKLLERHKPAALNHTCVMLVGDQDNKILFRRRIMDSYLLKENGFTKKLEVHKASNGPDLYFHFISQDWVGLDIKSTYTPFYLGATTVSNRLPTCNQTKRSSEVPSRQISHVKTETTAEHPRRGCNHRCANKSVCGHKCCNTGTTVFKRPPKTPEAGSRSCGKTISNYMCDLKNKLNLLTPSAKKIKMMPLRESKNSLNIERFSYTPRASTLTRMPSQSPLIGYVPKESHSNTDWLHLNLYQKCREDLMDDGSGSLGLHVFAEQERINEENELPDIDEHSPVPKPPRDNLNNYSPDNIGHFSMTPMCSNTGQQTVDRESYEIAEHETDNDMTTYRDLAATPPPLHQGSQQEAATYIQRPQYQRKLFHSTGADNKAGYRFKPCATLWLSDLLDSDDRRLPNSHQYNIEEETACRPLYADPSPPQHPDRNSYQVETTPRVCCKDQQNMKIHRFGQVVAWSNSQKTTKTGSSDEDWSGNDHDLITAETSFGVNRKCEESNGKTAMARKQQPVIVDEIDTKNKGTDIGHFEPAVEDYRSASCWAPSDCFCQDGSAPTNKDDANETFNSIFDGLF